MTGVTSPARSEARSDDAVDRDLEVYNKLLDLWSRENPIKTTKLQILLAVNALLVSAVNVSGGFKRETWPVYLAGALFSLVWTFSIGRTSLFQDLWQLKLRELQDRYPRDPRFAVLDTSRERPRARLLLRLFGAVPSKWYLLFSPFLLSIAWVVVLVVTR
jgi:hypothetical protein